MNKKPVISKVQLTLLYVGSALIFPYTFLPLVNSPPKNQDVWIVAILSIVYAIIINIPTLFIMNKYRGLHLVQISELTLGNVWGKVTIIPIMLFSIFCYTACSLIICIFLNLYVFNQTPMWVLLVYTLLPPTYAAYKGAGTIGRISTLIVPPALISVVLFFIFGFEKMDMNALLPILADSNFLEINLGAFITASRYSEILIFLVFSYYLMENASINKAYFSALSIFNIAFLLIIIPTIAVLGMEYAKHVWNPYFTYTRLIQALNFLERVQALNLLVWFPAAMLKLSIFNYIASEITSKIVRAKTHKYFVFVFTGFAFIFCQLPFMNSSYTADMLRSDIVLPMAVFAVVFFVPLTILIAYLVKRKKLDVQIKQLAEENKKDYAAKTKPETNP